MKNIFIPAIIFFVLVAFFIIALYGDPKKIPSPFIGKPAPAFSLPTLFDANSIISNENIKGEVVLLNVWASWCTACRQEHHLLVELQEQHNVKLIGLNYKDKAQDAKAWLKEFKNPYAEIAFDLQGKVGIDWGVYGVPETFVLDKNGIIQHKVIGPLTEEIMHTELLPLLNKLNNS